VTRLAVNHLMLPPPAGHWPRQGNAAAHAQIREALILQELPIVRQLFEEYASGLGIDLCFQRFAEELAGLPGSYARPVGGIWLAIVGGEVAGGVALRPLGAEACELKRMYVRPAFRGQGVGRQLVDRALAEARHAGYRRVCLDTLASMDAAISLYRSVGFRATAPYYDNPVQGALFFECDLT
jgi:GNAT superfamily N-acetyltransferase